MSVTIEEATQHLSPGQEDAAFSGSGSSSRSKAAKASTIAFTMNLCGQKEILKVAPLQGLSG